MPLGASKRTLWLTALVLCAAAWTARCQEPEVVPPAAPLPSPAYFRAEPAPNDNARRVGLSWPAMEFEADTSVYVIYVSRSSEGPWAACARATPARASVIDPAVAGFYPYRMSEGTEHRLVVEPVAGMPIYRFALERRYADWLQEATGHLLDCEQMLVGMERQVAAQRRFLRRCAWYKPGWEAKLLAAKQRYAQDLSPQVAAEDLDVGAELARLLALRRGEVAAAETPVYTGPTRAGIRTLKVARKYAGYLQDAAKQDESLRTSIAGLRDGFVGKAAGFFAIVETFRAEARLQVGAALGLAPEEVTPELVKPKLPELRAARDEAAKAARADGAATAELDRADELRYVAQLAAHYVELDEKGIPMEVIEADMLWRLERALADAEIEPFDAPEDRRAPDSEALAVALAQYRSAGLALSNAPEAGDWAGEQADWRARAEGWAEAQGAVAAANADWVQARVAGLHAALQTGGSPEPETPALGREITRLKVLSTAVAKRWEGIRADHARRRYYFRLAAAPDGAEPQPPYAHVASAAPRPDVFDFSKLTNALFALFFAGAVLFVIYYVRKHPNVFVRRIAGLEAVEEAIGRATEMGRPALFVHGLTGVNDIAVLASLSILGRLARKIADYDSDLLIANNDPIVYAISHQVVQEGYAEAGREDAFKPENNFIAASQQFPYVAAVAGIMKRRMPAANFFMGYFFAESLILAEVGASTGAIQIAATDSFSQLPFFITTCDYTLMGEELYAAGAYLSRNVRMLATIKAQDAGKAVMLAALPVGTALSNLGVNWLNVILTAYEKGF